MDDGSKVALLTSGNGCDRVIVAQTAVVIITGLDGIIRRPASGLALVSKTTVLHSQEIVGSNIAYGTTNDNVQGQGRLTSKQEWEDEYGDETHWTM